MPLWARLSALVLGAAASPDEALLAAAENGDPAGVAAALRRGADVEAETTVRCCGCPFLATPAPRARARSACAPAADRRARPAAPPAPLVRAQDGWSPLHFACAQGRADVALLLLDAGAAPDAATDGVQRTPLHWASRNGHADAVRLLLRRGAAYSARDVDGCAPLHLAAAAKDAIDVARLLLEVGADVAPRRKVRCARRGRAAPRHAHSTRGCAGRRPGRGGAAAARVARLQARDTQAARAPVMR
jgi:hypothetical protein